MDTKITTIKQRILHVAKHEGFTIHDFCEKIGISYSNFKGDKINRPITSDYLVTIVTLFRDISPEWLLTGNGEMLKANKSPTKTTEINFENEGETVKLLIDKITEQAVEIAELKSKVKELESQNTKTLAFPKPNLAAESDLDYKKGKPK